MNHMLIQNFNRYLALSLRDLIADGLVVMFEDLQDLKQTRRDSFSQLLVHYLFPLFY